MGYNPQTKPPLLFPTPAQGIPVDQDTFIRSSVMNSKADVVINILVRFMHLDGRISLMAFSHTPTSNLSRNDKLFRMSPGWILGIGVKNDPEIPTRRGETFCILALVRGQQSDSLPYQILISEYVADGTWLTWPGGFIRSSLEGPPLQVTGTVTNPAAGATFTFAPSGGLRWKLKAVKFLFTTDDNVANRRVYLRISDDSNVIWEDDAANVQTDGDTQTYYWAVDPDTSYIANTTRQPLLERNPLAFWKGVSLLLAVGNLVLAYLLLR